MTGKAVPGIVSDALCTALKPFLSATVKIRCPTSPDLIEVGVISGNNWFDNGSNNLPQKVRLVETYIEDMMRYGIPSSKIVLVGMSQGGALTFYTALHTRYTLGGIIGLITWLPRRDTEDPKDANTKNANTPLLHINGRDDTDVKLEYGIATKDALSQVIWDYTFKIYPGGHASCCVANPFAIRKIITWLNDNTPVSVRLCWVPFVC